MNTHLLKKTVDGDVVYNTALFLKSTGAFILVYQEYLQNDGKKVLTESVVKKGTWWIEGVALKLSDVAVATAHLDLKAIGGPVETVKLQLLIDPLTAGATKHTGYMSHTLSNTGIEDYD